jgi:CSLREA domain-containing protein
VKNALAVPVLIGALLCLATVINSAPSVKPQPIISPGRPRPLLFVVTSTGDGDNVGLPGACDDGTGNCTLRAAIESANGALALVTEDTIEFNIPTTDPGYDAGTGRWTINLGTVLPDLNANIAIIGPGEDKLVVQRSNAAAELGIFNVTTNGTANFYNMTISGGIPPGGAVDSNSGATVTISNCTLSNNGVSCFGGTGGAIYNGNNGNMSINNCKLIHNTASGGGAIEHVPGTGTLMITNSTIDDNTACDDGGGIYIGSGTAVITNSTISNNADGSGILAGGSLTIANCTITGNMGTDGGGIDNFGTLTITNSTISGNSIDGLGGNGGGIHQTDFGSTTVKGSIIA